jgi:A/G-specific adenine glycosylase
MLHGRELLAFRKKLLAWFREYQRDLPWRRTKDPYCIWVSEIMLQQTRVAAVIPYYERFLERFPDVQALANAPEDEVLRLWSGLGYYTRARNLQRAAREILAKHRGVFPQTHAEVRALSGIGDYTAAAILSIAYRARHAVVDGNVARVLARIFAIKGDLRESGGWRKLQKCAEDLLARKSPGDWNQAVMELGATLCTPRAPQCLVCPMAQFCRARKLGIADSLPAPRRKPATVKVRLAAAVFVDAHGQTLLLEPRRTSSEVSTPDDVTALVSQMWHFPMLAVRENAAAELSGMLKKFPAKPLLGRNSGLEKVRDVRHTVTYRKIVVSTYRVRVAKLPRGAKICPLEDLASASLLAISNLTRKIARAALARHVPEIPTATPKQPEGTLFGPGDSPPLAP